MTPLDSSGQSRSWIVSSQCRRLLSQESLAKCLLLPTAPRTGFLFEAAGSEWWVWVWEAVAMRRIRGGGREL